uniref:Mitogen-activated protein kinase 8 interacting protein 1a n=1 Tax=Gasterosteus aculeatus aculeatus TaxID=481459 RepID=A0AAQ4PLG5_GASAC
MAGQISSWGNSWVQFRSQSTKAMTCFVLQCRSNPTLAADHVIRTARPKCHTTDTSIKSQMPNAGYRMVQGHLVSMGLRIQWWRMMASMHRVDAAGIFLRLTELGCVLRRSYSVRGPHSLAHIDTNHKLIRYNIVLFGGVDGYSRKVIDVFFFFIVNIVSPIWIGTINAYCIYNMHFKYIFNYRIQLNMYFTSTYVCVCLITSTKIVKHARVSCYYKWAIFVVF